MEEDEWIQPKDHQGRKRRNVEEKFRHDKEEDVNRNMHHEMCEDDLDGEEDEGCPLKCNDKKREGNTRNNDELTEHECEIKFFNLSIDECV